MTSLVNVTAKAMTMACDIIGVLDAVNKMSCAREQHGNDPCYEQMAWFERASVINRLALLGFSSVEIGMILHGSKAESLQTLKVVEVFSRVGQVFLQPITEIIATPPNESEVGTTMRAFFRGIMVPIADYSRVCLEIHGYEEQKYLEHFAEDPKATRPTDEQKGERPIDPQECRTAIEQVHKIAGATAAIRMMAEAPGSVISTYELLSQFMQSAIGLFHHDAQASEIPLREGNVDWTNLMALGTIPGPLEADMVFQRYICSITLRPVRHPVRDPNGITLYERRNIEQYLGDATLPSPVTRRPMSRRDLQEVPGIQAIIDARLRQHQDHFRQYIQETAHRLPEIAPLP